MNQLTRTTWSRRVHCKRSQFSHCGVCASAIDHPGTGRKHGQSGGQEPRTHAAPPVDKAEAASGKEGHMTTESLQHQGEIDDPFASLSPYEFVLLTTFRQSGVGVPTAMWFAHEHGKLYLVTGRTTGKLKRIHTTSRVLVAPCDLMGNVLGPQIEAYARELPVAQHAHANDLLSQKYGEQYEMDASEADDEDVETFIEVVSKPHPLRGEQA